MKRIYIAVVIILLSAGLSSAWSPGDIEWAPAVTGTLHKGDTLTNGIYTVKVVQLASPVHGIKDINGNIVPEDPVEPSALLDVYKNGVFMQEIVLTLQSEAYTDPDYEVMISTTDFTAKNAREWVYEYYNPWVTVAISLRGKPKLEVTITTDKTAYTSNRDLEISANVEVKNSGDARANNVDVNLDADNLQVRGYDTKLLHQYYNVIEHGDSKNFDVVLLVPPSLIDEQSYSLKGYANGMDVKDIWDNGTGTLSITISPPQDFFIISKAVRDRMYLQNSAVVTITLGNHGIYDIHDIHLGDSLDKNFELRSNTSFQWYIPVLKVGEEWGTTYSIKPLEANLDGFTIPAATAKFTVNNKPFTVSSNNPKIVVNGPKLIINKTVDRQTVNISEYVNVSITVNNKGDIGTRFEVVDSLPDGVSLTGGSTSFANWSDPNSVLRFSYTIRMNKAGKIELPSAVSNYTDIDYRGTTRAVLSTEKPVITVIYPSKVKPVNSSVNSSGSAAPSGSANTVNTAEPLPPGITESSSQPTESVQPTPMTPGFSSVSAIIVLIFATVVWRKNRKI